MFHMPEICMVSADCIYTMWLIAELTKCLAVQYNAGRKFGILWNSGKTRALTRLGRSGALVPGILHLAAPN